MILKALNHSWMHLDATPEQREEVRRVFQWDVPGAEWSGAYRNGFWDGKISLFDSRRQLLPTGLLPYFRVWADNSGIPYEVDMGPLPAEGPLDEKALSAWLDALPLADRGEPIQIHPHQRQAVLAACRDLRRVVLIPTGGGKTLFVYCIVRFFQSIEPTRKFLIVVPGKGLLRQMYADFANYSSLDPDWDVEDNVHMVEGGVPRIAPQQVTICVRDSAMNLDQEWYDQYAGVVFDECHRVKADSVQAIAHRLTSAWLRIGDTATLGNDELSRYKVISVLGEPLRVRTTSDMIEDGLLAELDIEVLELVYPEADARRMRRRTYMDEQEYVLAHPLRMAFIVELVRSLDRNTLVLFHLVERHGKPLYRALCEAMPDRKIHYISGEVPGEERERIRRAFNSEEGSVLVANYQTVGTGINIPNIHNIVLSSGTKAQTTLMQAIGRGLRLSEGKRVLRVFDVADNLRWKKYVNHAARHMASRIEIYREQGFSHRVVRIPLAG